MNLGYFIIRISFGLKEINLQDLDVNCVNSCINLISGLLVSVKRFYCSIEFIRYIRMTVRFFFSGSVHVL